MKHYVGLDVAMKEVGACGRRKLGSGEGTVHQFSEAAWPAVRGRCDVRPLSWSKPTFEPHCRPLILLLQLRPGQRTSAGSAWDGKV